MKQETLGEVTLVPIDDLNLHPDNPRQGDVGAIATSIQRNGWFGSLVAQAGSGRVLVGNHRLQAARQLGFQELPVHWVDVDEVTARRILLADNRTSDLASYNDTDLVALLQAQIQEDDLIGTGWDAEELDDLLAEIQEAGEPEASSDECYTPAVIFDTLGIEFDIDPCSCPPELSHVPAKTMWTIDDDGLSKDWAGKVWLNPPYSKPDPWVKKFIENGSGIALLPTSGGAYWFYNLWDAADGIVPIHMTKIDHFERPDGSRYGIPFAIFLFALGEECTAALSNFEPPVSAARVR